MKLEKGDRIIMLRYDGWAEKGWTGTVQLIRNKGKGVSIKWDNGKRLAHSSAHVALLGSEDNPNTAFRLHKFNDRRKK